MQTSRFALRKQIVDAGRTQYVRLERLPSVMHKIDGPIEACAWIGARFDWRQQLIIITATRWRQWRQHISNAVTIVVLTVANFVGHFGGRRRCGRSELIRR